MKTSSSMLALAFLTVLVMSPAVVSADALVECTAEELHQISKTADAQGGILHACEQDTGFKLFPFTSVPADEDQRHRVCSGRSCPTAISNLQEAKLPACLMALGDSKQQATPADFLESLCTFNTTTPAAMQARSSANGSSEEGKRDNTETSSSGSEDDGEDGADLDDDASEN